MFVFVAAYNNTSTVRGPTVQSGIFVCRVENGVEVVAYHGARCGAERTHHTAMYLMCGRLAHIQSVGDVALRFPPRSSLPHTSNLHQTVPVVLFLTRGPA